MKRTTILPLLLLLTAVVGCRTTSSQRVPFPDQGVELEQSGSARIYLVRGEQTLGTIRIIRVFDGAEEIGELGRDGYLCWERPPGRSVVKLVFEGLKLDQGDSEGLLDLRCGAGEVHYYQTHLRTNDRQPTTERVETAEGESLVAKRRAPKVD